MPTFKLKYKNKKNKNCIYAAPKSFASFKLNNFYLINPITINQNIKTEKEIL